MHRYGVGEVERLLGLSRSAIRALIRAGFVAPVRGPRGAWRFSFQDLIVLRSARALAAAKVPHRRIARSVQEIRRHIPESVPLSGLSLRALGDRVVVQNGRARWLADSGQYLLALEGNPADGFSEVIEEATPTWSSDAEGWFDKGVALENEDAEAALRAYEQALAADPTLLDARINMGWLLHQAGRLAEAEDVYRDAIQVCGNDAVLQYNLGVLLDDMDRKAEAVQAYQEALRGNPELADCHYNLALLYEALDQPKDAIRHMAQYRRLTEPKRGG
jgi:tetratricopeptide (TPR) repeat protein